jgi:predicted nuclease of predicted toxin-antitoxin system
MGYDVKSVREVQHDLDDRSILAMAETERRVLITTDTDFGEIVFFHQRQHCGVFLVRMGNSSGSERAVAISAVVEAHGEELSGSFAVFDGERLRIHTGETPQ